MKEKAHIPDDVSLPADWSAQIEAWTEQHGPIWRNTLDRWARKKDAGKNARGFRWTGERIYEIVYFWNEIEATAVGIARWWIAHGIMTPAQGDADARDLSPKMRKKRDRRGVVDGEIRRMQQVGLLDHREKYDEDRVRNSIKGKQLHSGAPEPRPRENRASVILAMRRNRVAKSGGSFDNLSREARGMPSADLAQQQHPEYPEGVTYDAAYRIEHGRTTIFTEADQRRLTVSRQFSDIISSLSRVAALPLSVQDYEALRYTEQDLVRHGVMKILPQVKAVIALLESLPEPQFDRASDIPDHG